MSVPFFADSINFLISIGIVDSINKLISSVHTLQRLYDEEPYYSCKI